MNALQRRANRGTARWLRHVVRNMEDAKHVCENCGQLGQHWVQYPLSLADVLLKQPRGRYFCKGATQDASATSSCSS